MKPEFISFLFYRVDLMIEEWKDNIKLFSKVDERANDCKKLRENLRFQNTGIKVDKLASKLAIEFA